MKDRLTTLGYLAGWRLVRALPLPVARALFTTVADRAWKANGKGTQRLRRNYRQVAGPDMPETLVRDGLRSYARYWMEAFRLPSQTREQHVAGFHMEAASYDEMKSVIAEGNGIVLALPHIANWDAAAAWVVSHGWQMITVQERLKPEALFQAFMDYRESLGMRVLALTGGERAPLDVLAEHLRQGWVVPLLADRDMSRNGVEVEFFGGRTRMPAGPAILAVRSGAPMYAVDMWYSEHRVEARLRKITPPVDGPLDERVKRTTQLMADAFAAGIAEHPQDWHMLQKLWL
ncbi:lauroyl acyltransferase [Actinoplanes sp. SE50]|uniref:phosphatidylinositol mannoside acyltransferase n=1 Tax=unclassified Actinoplanes TaxID=2626549 RepID=UPI00023EBDFE|nr:MULTISPECIES: phosphatidylinositol mannoside acyltransferase [unclassified Actinoplanes]AEV87428.1 lipid A biosynthesis lauroyl acyltransferase [Actinoplanes sp. SE50/110]ATO85830.1 lauroyl acyltransferase [Actinoplanes sp. SE50]SLM03244.1 phosphatidylinositol mannoside acyltransferase [Actinoplanes sp. SE50/110]